MEIFCLLLSERCLGITHTYCWTGMAPEGSPRRAQSAFNTQMNGDAWQRPSPFWLRNKAANLAGLERVVISWWWLWHVKHVTSVMCVRLHGHLGYCGNKTSRIKFYFDVNKLGQMWIYLYMDYNDANVKKDNLIISLVNHSHLVHQDCYFFQINKRETSSTKYFLLWLNFYSHVVCWSEIFT